MELITWVLLGLFLLISGLLLSNRNPKDDRLPPGPRGLPFIGCPWALLSEFNVLFTKFADKWGDVVSVNILGETIVVLSSPGVVREAFSSQAFGETFSGRGPAPSINDHVDKMSSFLQPGPTWSKLRKILHKVLNRHGESLLETEKTIQEELTHVMKALEKAGQPVNMDRVIYSSLLNIITILLKGQRYDYDSPVLSNARVLDETAAQTCSPSVTLLFHLFPFLKMLDVGPGRLVRENQRAERQFVLDYFEEPKASYNPDVTRGMVDVLLRHQKETGNSLLTDNHIKGTLQEMIAAGVMTTRGALYSFFLITLHHPVVMAAIQNEIQAVVGESRFPKLEDSSQMPYTNAAILELLRYISHVPVGLPHRTTDDVIFHGYVIPKHTTVFCNLWYFHHDEKVWDNPWEFKPQRFLDADGNLVPANHPKRKNLMPFGNGRRSCVGESFAKSRLFLYITTLLQKFHITRDPERPPRSCDPRTYRPGIVLSPYEYCVKVVPRH
ncbi:cytochrome P450 2C31-like [Liolophura sinensis]|uniref:cytochrome P450 2C31-like n=1 Tax=Liolophura sinensis TaxID=3198878 RepID=UPI003159406A